MLRLQYLCVLFWNWFLFSNSFWVWFWLCKMRLLKLWDFLVVSLIIIGIIKYFISTFWLIKIFRINHDLIIYYMLLSLFNNHIIIIVLAKIIFMIIVCVIKIWSLSIFVPHVSLHNIMRICSFLQSFCISQGVQSVITRILSWIYTGNHNDSWLVFVPNKWVSQNHGKFGLSKWNMTARNFTIHRSNAFLQSEQWFIDLCSFCSSLLVVMLCVLSSLWTSEIN